MVSAADLASAAEINQFAEDSRQIRKVLSKHKDFLESMAHDFLDESNQILDETGFSD